MKLKRDEIIFAIVWFFIVAGIVTLLVGCTDNRIRIKPTLDYKINPAQKEIYRLHFMREIWAQTRLKADEKAYDLTGND